MSRAAGAPIFVLTVGATRRGPLADLEQQLLTRISRYAKVERRSVRQSRRAGAAERREEEAGTVLAAVPERAALVALDLRGAALDSAEFAARLEGLRERGPVALAIGGPDGMAAAVLERADLTLSLGPMTHSHELALAVLLEQLYRALAAAAGHPYARH